MVIDPFLALGAIAGLSSALIVYQITRWFMKGGSK